VFKENPRDLCNVSQKSRLYYEFLDMRKLLAKWVPKSLKVEQKHDRMLVSEAILEGFEQDPVEFF
jgi:hypothetical protein